MQPHRLVPIRRLVRVAGLAAVALASLATTAHAQFGAITISDGGAIASDGGLVSYMISVSNTSGVDIPAGGGHGTLTFSPGLTPVGPLSDGIWSCAAPVGSSMACTYLLALPNNTTTLPGSIDFVVDSDTAQGTCVSVAPPCVSVAGEVNPFVTPGFDDTPVLGPNPTRWTNAAGGSFADPLNWSNGVPGPGDTVTFELAASYDVTVPSGASLGSLDVLDGDVRFDLSGGGTLSVDVLQVGKTTGGPVAAPIVRIAGGGAASVGEASLHDDGVISVEDASSLRVATRLDVPAFTRVDVNAGGSPSGSVVVGSGPVPAAGTLAVSSDGTLGLIGAIGGDVENGGSLELYGILYVPTGNNVGGDYVQLPAGALHASIFTGVPIPPSTRSGLLRVAGDAALDGTVALESGWFTPLADLENRSVDLLLASSVSGDFAALLNHTRVLAFVEPAATPGRRARFLLAAACSDGIDNDQDGLVDYPADPTCADPLATSREGEPTVGCGLGPEAAFLLPLLAGVRARRRRGRLERGR